MKKLTTIVALLTMAVSANAKVGDTFNDPEFGKVTVTAPAFPDERGLISYWDKKTGKKQFKETTQYLFTMKAARHSNKFEDTVEKLHPNLTRKEIVALTQEFIDTFQSLKTLRKEIYLQDHNNVMVKQYIASIKNGQRAVKYKFWDYLIKIKGTPEFENLKKEINFSSQTLDNLKLYLE